MQVFYLSKYVFYILFTWHQQGSVFGQITAASQVTTVDYAAVYNFIAIRDTLEGLYEHPQEFLLMHSEGESRFHHLNKQYNDSMRLAYLQAYPQYANPRTQEEAQEAVRHFTANMQTWKKTVPVDLVVRKNAHKGTFESALTFAFPPQHMEEPLPLGWSLGNKRDTLMGLECYSAHIEYGGRNYTAWFAPGIPIPDGPHVFGGLPGLIVELRDEREWFLYQLKSLSPKPHTRFWLEDYIKAKSRKISRQSFVDQSRKQHLHPRMPSGVDATEEQLLNRKEQNAGRFHLLLESY
jgi:GLPGLI family protein